MHPPSPPQSRTDLTRTLVYLVSWRGACLTPVDLGAAAGDRNFTSLLVWQDCEDGLLPQEEQLFELEAPPQAQGG